MHEAVRNARLAVELEERHRLFLDNDVETRLWRRAWVCLMLARTPEAWFRLVHGRPVDTLWIDQGWLQHFRERGLWPS